MKKHQRVYSKNSLIIVKSLFLFLTFLIPLFLVSCANIPSNDNISTDTKPSLDQIDYSTKTFLTTATQQMATPDDLPSKTTNTSTPQIKLTNTSVPEDIDPNTAFDPSELMKTLDDDVDWHVLVKDLDTGNILFDIKPDEIYQPASMIKVPITMAVLKISQDLGRTIEDLIAIGIKGRSFNALMRASIIHSEEEATEILEFYTWESNRLRKIMDEWGLTKTTFDPRKSTCNDLAKALEGLHDQSLLGAEMSEYLIGLMLEQTENDKKYIGVMTSILPDSTFANKRGFMPYPSVVGDHGLLQYNDKTWLIIIAGTPNKKDTANLTTIGQSIERFGTNLAEQILKIYPPQP